MHKCMALCFIIIIITTIYTFYLVPCIICKEIALRYFVSVSKSFNVQILCVCVCVCEIPRNQFEVICLFLFVFQKDPPYNKGAFKISIEFPSEYPFKPPKITFKTKIYHPNIDEKGQVCLPIINAENWKPATKTEQGK